MGYICLSCMTEYTKENIKYDSKIEDNQCPRADCNNFGLFEIDDLILPIIRILNIKGYVTQYCCSGHGYDNSRNTYISFNEEFAPVAIPKGFNLEDERYYIEHYNTHKPDNGICIRKYYKKDITREEFEAELYKTMIELMEWVKNLPILN